MFLAVSASSVWASTAVSDLSSTISSMALSPMLSLPSDLSSRVSVWSSVISSSLAAEVESTSVWFELGTQIWSSVKYDRNISTSVLLT